MKWSRHARPRGRKGATRVADFSGSTDATAGAERSVFHGSGHGFPMGDREEPADGEAGEVPGEAGRPLELDKRGSDAMRQKSKERFLNEANGVLQHLARKRRATVHAVEGIASSDSSLEEKAVALAGVHSLSILMAAEVLEGILAVMIDYHSEEHLESDPEEGLRPDCSEAGKIDFDAMMKELLRSQGRATNPGPLGDQGPEED